MGDPVSVVLLTAAVGGALGGGASKFVEKACDIGAKRLEDFYRHQLEKAQLKAASNAGAYLQKLGASIGFLEDMGFVTPDQVEASLEHPEYSVLVQQALLAAAQTDSEEHHDMLARLVAERMAVKPETLLALATKIAVNALPNLNSRHFDLLSILFVVTFLEPSEGECGDGIDVNYWVEQQLSYYKGIKFSGGDLMHLASTSLTMYPPRYGGNIEGYFGRLVPRGFSPARLKEAEIYAEINAIWSLGLQTAMLTSAGSLVAVYSHDRRTGQRTDLSGWLRA